MENELKKLRKENSILKAELAKQKKARQAGACAANAKFTPEQRQERARKAVAARIAKYGQQTRKNN